MPSQENSPKKNQKTKTKTDLAAKEQKTADKDLPKDKEKEKRKMDKAFVPHFTGADLKYLDEMNYGTPDETFP